MFACITFLECFGDGFGWFFWGGFCFLLAFWAVYGVYYLLPQYDCLTVLHLFCLGLHQSEQI